MCEILGEDVELFSSVNARRKKDIENPARGIAKITKHGNVQCIAGHNMVWAHLLVGGGSDTTAQIG